MSLDYKDAAYRHREDADTLMEKQRWPNADQLYGFAAECALKAIMETLGMILSRDGVPLERQYRVHIDQLWKEFQTLASDSNCAGYAAALSQNNPFAEWNVSQRYYSTVSISEVTASGHKEGAVEVFKILSQAVVDGRL